MNKIDASRMFWPIQDKVNEILSRVDITDEKSIRAARRHVRAIKALMWDMWKNKEINEDIELGEIEKSLSHLESAAQQEAEAEKKTTLEVTGEGGGPIQMVSKEYLDAIAPFMQMLKDEQRQKHIPIPVKGTDRDAT